MSIFSHSSIYVLHLKIIKKHLTLLNSWLKNIYKNLCVGGACFSQEIHEMMQNYFYSSMRNKKCKDEAFLCVLYVEKATVKFKERTKRGFHTKYSATNGATLIKQKIIFGELKKRKNFLLNRATINCVQHVAGINKRITSSIRREHILTKLTEIEIKSKMKKRYTEIYTSRGA